jgi:invasion protein IalB
MILHPLHSLAMLLVVSAFVALSPPSHAQQNPKDDLADSLVKWDSTCSARGCLIQTDVLRGISGDPTPPDSKDSREYVSINVAMERSTRKPAYITFMVDPRAQQDQGIFVAFTNTEKVGDAWKVEIDKDGANRLPACECTSNACIARVPFGLVSEGQDRRAINLLDKFTESNALLVLYMKNGKPYRTMVLLSSFKKEYQRVLTSEFK